MREQVAIVSAVLVLAALVSIYILAVDHVLRNDNPINHHYDALIGFTVIDFVLVGLVLARPSLGLLASLAWGIIMVLAIPGDVVTGLQLPGVTPQQAAEYLFLGRTTAGGRPFPNPSGFAVDALLALNIILTILSARARRATKSLAPAQVPTTRAP